MNVIRALLGPFIKRPEAMINTCSVAVSPPPTPIQLLRWEQRTVIQKQTAWRYAIHVNVENLVRYYYISVILGKIAC